MKSALFALVVGAVCASAALNGPCTVGSTPGVCITTTTCSSGGGTTHSGYCPNDADDVKCCTKTCGSGGTCKFSSSCSGTTQSGLCPGPTDFKCCLPSSGGGSSCTVGPSVNSATVTLIKNSEGFVSKPAPDPIGLPTVGYGHLCQKSNCSEVPYSFPLTTTTATQLLQSDLKTYQNCVAQMIKVRLNANQYGALVSFTFNMGCSAAKGSTLVARLNAGENPNTVAAQELPKWVNAGGQQLPGLVTRRKNEVALFQTATSTGALPC